MDFSVLIYLAVDKETHEDSTRAGIKLTPMQVHLSLIGIGQVLPNTNFTVAIASTLIERGCTHGVEAIRPKVRS